MPQGRRKVPFSGKAKKVQIQMKREKKEELSEQRRPSEKGIFIWHWLHFRHPTL